MAAAKDHFHDRIYQAIHSTGPFKWLNPTTRLIPPEETNQRPSDVSSNTEEQPVQPDQKAVYVWRSRDNRKGRHALAVSQTFHEEGHQGPSPTESWEESLKGIGKMFTRYPIWDVSYDVAVVFTIGSVIWVFNGFFSWLPLAAPSSLFKGEETWGGGITAFIGATVFEFGSVLLMLEAVNESRSDCFGWAVEESIDGFWKLDRESSCGHHHRHKKAWLKPPSSAESSPEGGTKGSDDPRQKRRWSWWPSWYELRTHYLREVGFLACASQMFGATVFWISGFTALPPILNSLSVNAADGVYWLPQVIGGCGFIVSSTLFMIEVQTKWYIPAPRVLGWHIGLWNLIGAIGFTLCGALGFGEANPSVDYALALSTFIGSWAFLIGSVIQWFESLNKYPIWVDGRM